MTRIKHLYIHVPFCSSICYYCDFCHRVYAEDMADRWLKRLKAEIEDNCGDQYETIYIGGGTPTALSSRQLSELLEMLKPYTEAVEEYTIEVNPESLDEEKIGLFVSYGINRVSMGVQSADDDLLKTLNRRHTFADVKSGISLLKEKGIDNISVDLMYSLPGQDMQILQKTLEDILALDVPHISLYSLTIEENTVFGKRGVKALDEDTEADMYEYIDRTLRENGYIHYEVSNFCHEGYASRHNMGYWLYEDFLGLSIGASGKIGNKRYTNTRDMKRYLESTDIREEDLWLTREELMFENIMMSLRTIWGLDIERFNTRYDCDILKEYEKGVAQENVKIENGRLICTNLEVLNSVLLSFMK